MPPATRPPLLPQVHPTYARLLRMLLRALRVDADDVLAQAGLSWATLIREDRGLPFAIIERLAHAATSATGRPWIGLELGSAVHPSSHGAVGYAVMASRNLREALQTVVRFAPLRVDLFDWHLDPHGGGAVLRVVERYDLGSTRSVVVDALFASVLRLIESVVGIRPDGVRVDLPVAAPPWRDHHEACGAGELRFGQPVLAFHLPDALLDAPCLTADACAFDHAVRECEAALALHGDGAMGAQVQGLLRAVGESEAYPTLVQAADRLGVSTRTLMRRLQANGSSYQQLLDEARKERALWYLQHTHYSIEDIAGRLGYLDTSNFSRTVRRWFGTTPGELRSDPA
jgi:AraC-like DNA-binding protein